MADTAIVSLDTLLADPLFDPRHHLAADEQDELTYRQLGHLNHILAADLPLVSGDQRLLRNLLELTAVTSPSLFMAFFLHHGMATGAIVDYGGDPVELPGFGAVMMTELGYGSSSANLLTEAHYDPATGDFALRTPCEAAVKFPSNIGAGGPAKWGVVSARLIVDGMDRGPFLFRLQLRDADGPRPGVNIRNIAAFPQIQLDYGSARFTDARVPRSGWLADGATITDGVFRDPLGDSAERTQRTVSVSRIAHCSVSLGLAAMARACLAAAIPFARRRLANNRFGDRRPLIAFRNEQRRLVDGLASAFAATALARRTAPTGLKMHARLSTQELRGVWLVKVAVSRLAAAAAARAQESCGAAGYVVDNGVLRYCDFASTFQNSGGDNQMYLLNAAYGMVEGHDYEPPDAAEATADGVLDRCLALLRRREHDLYWQLVTARDEVTAGPFAGWNGLADEAQRFVEAHVARMTVAEFRAYAAEDTTLLALCELLAVNEVLEHDGWHLTEDTVKPAALRELSTAADRIHDRLVGDLDGLVRLLEIPAAVLRSPLADDRLSDTVAPAQH